MTLSSQPLSLFGNDGVEAVIQQRQHAKIARHADRLGIRQLLHALGRIS